MISIIIPAYYSSQELVDITARCLNGLRGADIDEIILIDDGSPIRAMHEVSTIDIRLETNGGYANAVNTGLKKAKGDILIVCNNDIEFISPIWLEALTYPLSIGYSISSIRTTDADGWEVEQKITEGNKFGSIFAMKREVYETLGGMDDSFGRGYFEDLDYWHRAQDAGFKIAKNHAGLVEHIGQATFKTLGTEGDKIYNLAMLAYKEKWGNEAHLILQSDGVVLADKYDLLQASPEKRQQLLDNEISLGKVKEGWGL